MEQDPSKVGRKRDREEEKTGPRASDHHSDLRKARIDGHPGRTRQPEMRDGEKGREQVAGTHLGRSWLLLDCLANMLARQTLVTSDVKVIRDKARTSQ